MPGSRPSSSITRVSAGGISANRPLPHQAGRKPHSRSHGAHLLARQLARLVHRVVHGRQHQVLEHVDIGGGGDFRLHPDRQHPLVTRDHHPHHPPPRGARPPPFCPGLLVVWPPCLPLL